MIQLIKSLIYGTFDKSNNEKLFSTPLKLKEVSTEINLHNNTPLVYWKITSLDLNSGLQIIFFTNVPLCLNMNRVTKVPQYCKAKMKDLPNMRKDIPRNMRQRRQVSETSTSWTPSTHV